MNSKNDYDPNAGWLNNWENDRISDEELKKEVEEILDKYHKTSQITPHMPTNTPKPFIVRTLFPLEAHSDTPAVETDAPEDKPLSPHYRPADDFSLEQKKSIQALESLIAQNHADEDRPDADQALTSMENDRLINAWRMKQKSR